MRSHVQALMPGLALFLSVIAVLLLINRQNRRSLAIISAGAILGLAAALALLWGSVPPARTYVPIDYMITFDRLGGANSITREVLLHPDSGLPAAESGGIRLAAYDLALKNNTFSHVKLSALAPSGGEALLQDFQVTGEGVLMTNPAYAAPSGAYEAAVPAEALFAALEGINVWELFLRHSQNPPALLHISYEGMKAPGSVVENGAYYYDGQALVLAAEADMASKTMLYTLLISANGQIFFVYF